MGRMNAERLRSLIDYDAQTGVFAWKPRGHRAGTHCNRARHPGSVSKQTGYLTIRVDGKLYQAHRLAWLHHFGEWPPLHLDHINCVKLDNRIANLRSADDKLNRENVRSARRDSGSGLLGAFFDKRRGRFFSAIRVNRTLRHIGALSGPPAEAQTERGHAIGGSA